MASVSDVANVTSGVMRAVALGRLGRLMHGLGPTSASVLPITYPLDPNVLCSEVVRVATRVRLLFVGVRVYNLVRV